ncbi:hypothetical protein EDB86DRAFT_3075473 [Lactarius hatsudake]|nr:hypothetical protein EDB86DRAFT_3075473 [Lactarius hatsudake]
MTQSVVVQQSTIFPPNAHESLSSHERGLMAKITLDPVPAPCAQPSVFAHIDGTFDLLQAGPVLHDAIWVDNAFSQPRSPVPVIASTSSSVSSLPFSPAPSRSSLPERESNMMVISATGPGDVPATDYAPVSHKIDDQPSQQEKGQPPPAFAGASRRSSSSQSRVPPCCMSKMLFLPSPSESTSSEPPPANVTETEITTL